MHDLIFIQHPDVSGETFVLRGDRVVVGETVAGRRKERVVSLSEIMPHCTFEKRRVPSCYIAPLILGGVIVVLGYFCYGRSEFLDWIAVFLWLLAPACLIPAMHGFDPVEVAVFKSRNGHLLFKLYRHKKAALPYDEFVEELCRRLKEQDKTGEPKHAES